MSCRNYCEKEMCWVFSGTCKEAVINNVKNETLQTARGL